MYWAVWEEWGTNYRRYAEAETREGIDQKILTRSVYPAKKHTIQIFVVFTLTSYPKGPENHS